MGMSSKKVTENTVNSTQMEGLEIPMATEMKKAPTLRCPRCDSTNTKFCYYNNYSMKQPRHFCRTCHRYWTAGGNLRNVPVGGVRKKLHRNNTAVAASGRAVSISPAAPGGVESSDVFRILLPENFGQFGSDAGKLNPGTGRVFSAGFPSMDAASMLPYSDYGVGAQECFGMEGSLTTAIASAEESLVTPEFVSDFWDGGADLMACDFGFPMTLQ